MSVDTDEITCGSRKDGFTPERQRAFLAALACEGYVDRACAIVGISRDTVYGLRQRAAGAAFALGWEAALLIARVRIADMLMARAIEGQTDITVRDPDSGEWRRNRVDNRLGLALLGRLDKFADARPGDDAAAAHADARLVSQGWEAYLDLIEAGHEGSGAALFLSARRPETSAATPLALEPCQFCGDDPSSGGLEDAEDDDPCTIWEESDGSWQTDFPPPDGFDGFENGSFGEFGYWRELSALEDKLNRAGMAAENAPVLAAAITARDRFFAECRERAEEQGLDIDSFATELA